MISMASRLWAHFEAPSTKSINISSENPNVFEAYNLYSHYKYKKFELMFTRRAKAYSSFGSEV